MRNSETSLTDVLGQEFGPYKLVQRLGVGGMAETFVAIRRGPSGFTQRVCLKLVLPFYREDEDFIALFEREARLAAKLRHRNIVGVIDFGEFEGTSYIALELVDGLDLRSMLDVHENHRVPTEYVTLLGLELAEALEHAHNPPLAAGIEGTDEDVRGIVHRDISPSNVLLSREGEILLTDFGVAKAITRASRKQSAVKGKVPYMSPEQLRAESLDGRADLFSLGVVLFEALAGERPYEGAHDPATIMQILSGEHPPLASLAPEAPPGLCDVIERLIRPDRESRPATAAALIEALADFAPSPRVRLELGRSVRQLGVKVEQKKAKRGSGRVNARTEVLPEADSGAVPDTPSVEVPSKPQTAESRPPDPDDAAIADTAAIAAPHRPIPTPPPATPTPTPETPAIPLVAQTPAPTPPSSTDPGHLVRPPREPVVEPRPATRRKSKGRWSRREFRVFAAGLVLILGSAAALAWVLWPSSEASERPSPTIIQPKPEPEHAPQAAPEPKPEEPVQPRPEPTPEPEPELPPPLEQRAEEPPPPKPEVTTEPRAEKPSKTTTKPRRANPETNQQKATAPKPIAPKPERQARTPGRLTITIFPWGNIWINGQPWGAAPLTNEPLPPGTYKISVGQDSPTKTRIVRLKPGQRRAVRFDLSE